MDKQHEEAIKQYVMSIKGLRGRDIPEHIYDQIKPVADGITMPIWGRPATPDQLQHLYDSGAHDPAAIHAAFGGLKHPHAPDLTLSEYQAHSKALQTFKQHGGQM